MNDSRSESSSSKKARSNYALAESQLRQIAGQQAGGSAGDGTVFELRSPSAPGDAWTETTLYTFTGGSDGCGPTAPPVLASDGSLYGTTFGSFSLGGYPWADGNGTVFRLVPPAAPGGSWTKTLLRTLGKGDGWGPDSTLIVRDGTIYGTAAGTYGGGLYRLQQPAKPGEPWTLTTLHHFRHFNLPGGNLVMDNSGALFGVTTSLPVEEIPDIVYRIKP